MKPKGARRTRRAPVLPLALAKTPARALGWLTACKLGDIQLGAKHSTSAPSTTPHHPCSWCRRSLASAPPSYNTKEFLRLRERLVSCDRLVARAPAARSGCEATSARRLIGASQAKVQRWRRNRRRRTPTLLLPSEAWDCAPCQNLRQCERSPRRSQRHRAIALHGSR